MLLQSNCLAFARSFETQMQQNDCNQAQNWPTKINIHLFWPPFKNKEKKKYCRITGASYRVANSGGYPLSERAAGC